VDVTTDLFRFDGKRALVVGGASGMGAACGRLLADLGATVAVMDFVERPLDLDVKQYVRVDLREKASIDAGLAELEGEVDVLLACAGVADGTPGIDRVNFIGQRHLIESLVEADRMPPGSAIAMISSVAGLLWDRQMPLLGGFLDTPDFDAAVAWIDAHPDKASYYWTKQAVCAYVARQAFPFRARGIRINATQPGPTDTPLARANADTWLAFAQDYREAIHAEAATPEDQALPLLFLCSDAARQVNGVSILVDAGYVSAGVTGAFDAPAIRAMHGLA
jgi:NAD(P)-dependent dehydrogenase (short-subunit alcohol dehydrogenase family)